MRLNVIGLLGNGDDPHKDCGCKFKVRSVNRAVFFPSNGQLPWCRLNVGRKLDITNVVIFPGKYNRRLHSFLLITDFPG